MAVTAQDKVRTHHPNAGTARRVVAAMAGLALAVACGDGTTEPPPPTPPPPTPPPDPPRATTVEVMPPEAELTALGATVRFAAQVRDQNGQAMAGAAVAWSSGNPSVATVDASGKAEAAGDGTTTITAASGDARGTAAVTVARDAHAAAVTPGEAALVAGDTIRLSAEAYDANGFRIETAEFVWTSRDAAVAEVDAAGLVRAVAEGEARIAATSGAVFADATVTVRPEARTMFVTPSAATLYPGDTVRVAAEVWDRSRGVAVDATVAWESSNASVAKVGAAGLVRAAGVGDATITATSGAASATARVAVVERSDRGALVSLYRSTAGPGWVNQDNWLTDAPIRDWHGVAVDGDGRVVGLELPSNNLVGPLPPSIGQLTGLQRATFEDNALRGPIPPEIGNLTSLSFLILRANALSGPIPPEIGRLTAMETLSLGSNSLDGPIPPEMSNLTSLGWVDLGENNLTGRIPPQLAIAGLQTLIVRENRLHGPVPRSFLRVPGLTLQFFFPDYRNLYLCLPGTADFVAWKELGNQVGGRWCNESDMDALEAVHRATGGGNWTNSVGWSSGPALGDWHGVETDSLGRVTALRLAGNGLSGNLPARLGHLTAMTALDIVDNALTGGLPTTLTGLPLRELRYSGTGLCVPDDEAFQAWLETVAVHEGTGVACPALTDRDILVALYRATDGPDWSRNDHWLTDAPLSQWHGVGTDAEGRVESLNLAYNNLNGVLPAELGHLTRMKTLILAENPLTGPIPPELGNLSNLERLWLYYTLFSGPLPPELGSLSSLEELWLERIPLRGPIPPALGDLSSLRFLVMNYSNLSGPIPAELGRLSSLETLSLGQNRLAGSIPGELGDLSRLENLGLHENDLTGSIPPELGGLTNLRRAWLHDNGLTGTVPPALGDLASAEVLNLSNNDLDGSLPATFGDLARLEFFAVSNNAGMSGVLPPSLRSLARLDAFLAGGTALCAPDDPLFGDWLANLARQRVLQCPEGERSEAYLTQAVQSLDYPVALVADETALLRVFVTAPGPTDATIPPVRARFFHNGSEVHTIDIAGGSGAIPTEIREGELSKSANAEVPEWVVRPGLEMAVEIDPDDTLAPGLGVQRRIPETGRKAVDVHEMPRMEITWIPMISRNEPDSSILAVSEGLTAEDDLFWDTRTLMPIRNLEVGVHDPVWTSTTDQAELIREVEAIRVMEGGPGYYMGSIANPTGSVGLAYLPGFSSVVTPSSSVIVHELGHNFSLRHAPCGGAGLPDEHFPSATGSIGAWGYDFRGGGALVSASRKDLMGYCTPHWIGEYSFARALSYRLSQADARGPDRSMASTPSLLLWGGTGDDGLPYLEPAFVVDAAPTLPDSAGSHRLTGRTRSGTELFSFSFAMPEVADGDGGSSFVFALPARSGWEELASIALTGPDGSATLDARTDRPMAILRDPASRQVRAVLRDLPPAMASAEAAAAALPSEPGLEVLFSRGIPETGAWRR